MEKRVITNSDKETRFLGKKIANDCLKAGVEPKSQAMIFAMYGDLGSGKTTFTQGFAEGLGVLEKILSPTFVILKKFKIGKSKNQSPKFRNFYHIDCYRLNEPAEILALGFEEIISDPANIVVIEWAEKIEKVLPESAAIIHFNLKGEDNREIIIKSKYNVG